MRLREEQDNSLKLRLEELYNESGMAITVVDILCLTCVKDHYIAYFSFTDNYGRMWRDEVMFYAQRSDKGFTNFAEIN